MDNNTASSTTSIHSLEPTDIAALDVKYSGLGVAGITVYVGGGSSTVYVSEDAARVIVARLTEILADLPAKVEAA